MGDSWEARVNQALQRVPSLPPGDAGRLVLQLSHFLSPTGPGPASCIFAPLWTSYVPGKERLAWPSSHGHQKLRTTAPRAQMNPKPNRPKPNKVTFAQTPEHVPSTPHLTGEPLARPRLRSPQPLRGGRSLLCPL